MVKANCKYIVVTRSDDGSQLLLGSRDLEIEAGTVVIWLLDRSVAGSFGKSPISGQLSDAMNANSFSKPEVSANGQSVAVRLLASPPIEAVYQLTATVAGESVSTQYDYPEGTALGKDVMANVVSPTPPSSPKIKTG